MRDVRGGYFFSFSYSHVASKPAKLGGSQIFALRSNFSFQSPPNALPPLPFLPFLAARSDEIRHYFRCADRKGKWSTEGAQEETHVLFSLSWYCRKRETGS